MLLLLLACLPGDPEPPLDGGQSGNEGSIQAPHCVEVSRVPLGLDDVADGFHATPRQVLDAWVGSWAGVPDAGVLADAAMDLSWADGPVDLVSETRVAFHGTEGAVVTVREPSDVCPTHFDLSLEAVFTGFDGAFQGEILSMEVSTYTAHFALPEESLGTATLLYEDVAGTASPPWDPNLWPSTSVLFETSLTNSQSGVALLGRSFWVAGVDPLWAPDGPPEPLAGFLLER